MFGFEFSDLKGHHSFPIYDVTKAVPAESIERMVPLVWQEHCVECGMPECYKTCVRYQKRSDGRCKLFQYGIERIPNSHAILGQNAIIEMRPWAKLETFFFPAVLSYRSAQKVNDVYVTIAKIAHCAKNGKLRRLCYYAKEYISRKIGYREGEQLPQYLLFEVVNDNEPYAIALENHADNQVVFRTTWQVAKGYNRFLIPTNELRFQNTKKNTLCIYSGNENDILLNIISLGIVDFKPQYKESLVDKNQKKVKVVVWDLDNTLWDGILSEDGLEQIKLKQEVLNIVKELDKKGIINSIASKNDFDKAFDALKTLSIDEYFVAPMINWQPKSQGIKAIAKNLDLGLDTFVFVDDTPNELQEVATNCNGVRVCDVRNIIEYVQGEAFDVPVTEESKNRRRMYQDLSRRNADALSYQDNIDDFLKDCRMVMDVSHPEESEIERCFELLQRTNQLNISAERLSRDEVKQLVSASSYDCYRINVCDKYGNYGLVGFAVFNIADPHTVVLEHFVFSCRAARKKLEQSFFEEMIEYYKKMGYCTLRLRCKRTEKNALMQTVLMECGIFKKEKENAANFELTVCLEDSHSRINIAQIDIH